MAKNRKNQFGGNPVWAGVKGIFLVLVDRGFGDRLCLAKKSGPPAWNPDSPGGSPAQAARAEQSNAGRPAGGSPVAGNPRPRRAQLGIVPGPARAGCPAERNTVRPTG